MNFLRKSRPSLNRSIFSKVPSSKSSPTPLFSRSISFSISKHNPIPNPSSQWRLFYRQNRGSLQHFRSRRLRYIPHTILLVVVLGGSAIITIYYSHRETVPYTNRPHFVLVSPSVERQLGEHMFQKDKDALKGKILPTTHPDSVRVGLISKNIIEALHREFYLNELQWGDHGWNSDNEILHDQRVQPSRKKAVKSSRSVPQTSHLNGLLWEVVVVQDKTVIAKCIMGGKILIFSGILDHFRSDAEIATMVAHEVAHIIARHAVERLIDDMWSTIVNAIIYSAVLL